MHFASKGLSSTHSTKIFVILGMDGLGISSISIKEIVVGYTKGIDF